MLDDQSKELEALNAIAAIVSQSLDLDDVLNDALDKTLQVMEIEAAGIYLLDEGNGLLTVAAQRGFNPQFASQIDNLKLGEGFSGRVAQSGQPLVVQDVAADPRLTRMAVLDAGLHALAVAPVIARGIVLGTLFAATHSYREFSDQDVQLLTSIGYQIGMAIEHARLFRAEQRRAEQFRVISEVGHQITTVLAVDETLAQIVNLVKDKLGYHQAAIGLIEGQELVFRTAVGVHWRDIAVRPLHLDPDSEGITGLVVSSGQPLVVPDVDQEPRYYRVPGDTKTRSELAVPLKTKDSVIGALVVSSERLNGFDNIDVSVLQSLAYQAAMAIDNARLFEAEQMRAEQFRVISEVGWSITSIMAVDELLKQMTALIKVAFNYHGVGIGLIERDQLVFRAGSGSFWDDPGFQPLYLQVGQQGITGWVAAEGEPLLVPDVSQEARYYHPSFLEAQKTRSELAVPMKVKGKVIGVLDVESDRFNAFGESDLIVLQSLANQAAIAIDNARLFDAEQRRAEQFRVISEVGSRITSILDIDEVLVQAVRMVQKVFGYDHVGIALIEGGEAEYKVGAGRLWDEPGFEFRPARLKVGQEGVTGWVAASGEPLMVPDVMREPRYVWMVGSKTRSELAVPIKVKGEVIGVLDAQSEHLNAFDEGDRALLQSLANQVAIAIENARLLEAERRRQREATLLADMARLISGTLDLDEVLQLTAEYAVDVFGVHCCCILLFDSEQGALRVATQIGLDAPEASAIAGVKLLPNEDMHRVVFTDLQPLIVEDVPSAPYLGPPDVMPLRSALVVPIEIGGRRLGAMQLGTKERQPRRFTTDEGELALAMANQAAVAIENARLFKAEERRAEQFRFMSEVGRRITTILAVDELLVQMARLIRDTFDYYHVGFGLVEGENVVSKAEVGVSANAYRSARRGVGQEGVWGWVAHTGEPLLIPDVGREPRFRPMPEAAPVRSQLCVPLKTKEGVIGVLSAESDRLAAFDASDLAVLQSLASQMAVAIENARHYEQAQQVAALQERSRLARELHDAVTQTLFSASLLAEAFPSVWEANQEEGRQLLSELRQLNRGALAEMRTLLLELRPAALVETYLGDLLRQLAEAVTGRTGLLVGVTVEGRPELPDDVHVALYRIAQEALNNVVKHAHASQVDVLLGFCTPDGGLDSEHRKTVLLRVRDDGRGFDPSTIPPDRLGLGIMRERVQAIQATIAIETRVGRGTQLSVVWPAEERTHGSDAQDG